jgi:hypothetical protein
VCLAQPGARITYANADVEGFQTYVDQLRQTFPNARIVHQGTVTGADGVHRTTRNISCRRKRSRGRAHCLSNSPCQGRWRRCLSCSDDAGWMIAPASFPVGCPAGDFTPAYFPRYHLLGLAIAIDQHHRTRMAGVPVPIHLRRNTPADLLVVDEGAVEAAQVSDAQGRRHDFEDAVMA